MLEIPVRRSSRIKRKSTADDRAEGQNENGHAQSKRRRSKSDESTIKRAQPANWKEVWEGISEMRESKDAPVDTMGCEVLAEDEDPKVHRYQTLISLMLSSQTKDQQTSAAMQKLQRHGLTVANILNTSESTLAELISNVSFYRNKAKFIKRATETLHSDFDDDIPSSYQGLLDLRGVGPKMAHLTLQCAWGKTEGIGVDIHVHRITNRLGWANKTKNPEATRKELEEWLPRDHWGRINLLLVGFGQTICTPRNPKCDRCKVRDLCLEGSAQKQAEEKRRKKKPVKRRVKDDARDTDEEEASVEESEDEYRPS